jgi:hypothetical protein
MKTSKPLPVIVALLLLGACVGGLPPWVRRDIAHEHDQLQHAERQVQHLQQIVREDVANNPDLFSNASTPEGWTAKFQAGRDKLASAENVDRELADLSRRNRGDSREKAERLLVEARNLRESAVDESKAVEAAANRRVDFKHDLASNLQKMRREYDAVRAADLGPLSTTLEKTGRDWPAKKDALNARLASLSEIPKASEAEWNAAEAARQDALNGNIDGQKIVTLIEIDDVLARNATSMAGKANELRGLCGQLYDSWDKILTDLDASAYGSDRLFRERIKTVRTHLVDLAAKTSETSSEERWVNVSESSFHAVENDLGMAIAHKDAGLFDSEAQETPQPAGFAYIAPESQGSNQFGYWDRRGGETFWTWLPQYLILRELLWDHDYRPVVVDEYRGYRSAQSSGHTYYGQATPASPPKYGSHGTFTETHYAQSRYVQSGGFKGSAYASNKNGSAPSSQSQPAQHQGSASQENGAGRRFGSGAGSSSGRHFGQSGGSRSPGRSFGRHR